ncbi:16S rRNA (cytosine(1402)-N(4))-methyltransferase RsmH [Candidatus Uhrbacteria bacterium]|nr:16S rRNA (cytosine(1402)-N(4))-methyltransferase RsmH [Candidatus Uhrbacteria bacterium]
MPHVPVLFEEVLRLANPQPGDTFVDCTFGAGGHAGALLDRIAPNGILLGIDANPRAITAAQKNFASYGNRLVLRKGNFKNLKAIAYDVAISQCAGILMDLGVSSEELVDQEIGLSFQVEGPLDMRLSREGPTAAEIVNGWPAAELTRIIRQYGEERYAAQIVRAILKARRARRIATTLELAELVTRSVPRGYEHGRIHPATRTFQALRIAVNDELGSLEAALPQAVELLRPSGRLIVIAFHSLEDRTVKRFFRQESGQTIRILTKKPVQAGEEEVRQNPRARSAKLRAVERL